MELLSLLGLAAQNAGTRAATAPAPNSVRTDMAPSGVRPMPDDGLGSAPTDVRSDAGPSADPSGRPFDPAASGASATPSVPGPSPLTGIAALSAGAATARGQAQRIREASAARPAVKPRKMTGVESGVAGLLALLAPDAGRAAVGGFQQGAGEEASRQEADRQQQGQSAEVQAQGLDQQAARLDALAGREIQQEQFRQELGNKLANTNLLVGGKNEQQLIKELDAKDAGARVAAGRALGVMHPESIYANEDTVAALGKPRSDDVKNVAQAGKADAQAGDIGATQGARIDRIEGQADQARGVAKLDNTKAYDIDSTQEARVRKLMADGDVAHAQAYLKIADGKMAESRKALVDQQVAWYPRKMAADIDNATKRADAVVQRSNDNTKKVNAQISGGKPLTQAQYDNLHDRANKDVGALKGAVVQYDTEYNALNDRWKAIQAGHATATATEREQLHDHIFANRAKRAGYSVMLQNAIGRRSSVEAQMPAGVVNPATSRAPVSSSGAPALPPGWSYGGVR